MLMLSTTPIPIVEGGGATHYTCITSSRPFGANSTHKSLHNSDKLSNGDDVGRKGEYYYDSLTSPVVEEQNTFESNAWGCEPGNQAPPSTVLQVRLVLNTYIEHRT